MADSPSVILKMKSNKGKGDQIAVSSVSSNSEGWVTIELQTGHMISLPVETVEAILQTPAWGFQRPPSPDSIATQKLGLKK